MEQSTVSSLCLMDSPIERPCRFVLPFLKSMLCATLRCCDEQILQVTVVTGFLGAGKTTLVNYILKEQVSLGSPCIEELRYLS